MRCVREEEDKLFGLTLSKSLHHRLSVLDCSVSAVILVLPFFAASFCMWQHSAMLSENQSEIRNLLCTPVQPASHDRWHDHIRLPSSVQPS